MSEDNKKNEEIKNKNEEILNEKNIEVTKKVENKEKNKNVGFWKRVAATFLDWTPGLLLSILFSVLYANKHNEYLANMTKTIESNGNIDINIPTVILILFLILFGILIYHIYLYYKYGQGIGYKILGFKIVDENTKERPKKVKLLKRWIIKKLGKMIFLFAFIFIIIITQNSSSSLILNNALVASLGVFLFILIYALAYLWPWIIMFSIGLTKNRRGLHDKWSQTIVVQENNIKAGLIVFINIVFIILFSIIVSQRMSTMDRYQDNFMKNNVLEKVKNHSSQILGEDEYSEKLNEYEEGEDIPPIPGMPR